jgi:hypothetical protein
MRCAVPCCVIMLCDAVLCCVIMLCVGVLCRAVSSCCVLLQLSTLEMVAQSRHNGAVSSDMANALAIQHRNFFYVLKVGQLLACCCTRTHRTPSACLSALGS